MEPFKYSGYWWLPEDENNQHFGTLSFSHEEGLRLETFGSFTLDALKPGQSLSLGNVLQYPLIKGFTREGKWLTLFDCDSEGPAFSGTGFRSEKFLASYAFEEVNNNRVRSPPSTFREAFVQYTYLPDWLGSSGIQEDFLLDEEKGSLVELKIAYKAPDNITADLGYAEISIAEGYTFSNRNKLLEGVKLQTATSLKINLVESLGLDDWLIRYVGPLQDFLTLAVRRSNAITKLTLYSDQNQLLASDGTSKASATKVYYRQPVAQEPRVEKTLSVREMLFSFEDVKDEFGKILETWFSTRSRFDSIMDLFFAVEDSSGMYLNNEFLNLVQASEVYHRERFVNLVIPKSDFKAKKKALVESVPEEHRRWLVEQLAYANQPKLYQRLTELLEYTQKVTEKLVSDPTLFARKVTDTRNFLTHFSRKSGRVMDGEELFRATQVLSYTLQACFMLELGMSQEKMVALFERNQRFLFTVRQVGQARYWA